MGKANMQSSSGGIPGAQAVTLGALVDYGPGAIVSRTIAKTGGSTMTLFAFDEGQELSEHSAPFDAYVQVLDGTTELRIDGKPVRATAGETVLMPANIPHAVKAVARFKMLLTMLREPKKEG